MRSIRARSDLLPWALALAAVGALALPAGCSRGLSAPVPASGEEPAAPRRGGTLHLASLRDARNLDPAGPIDGLGMQAITLLFDGLIDFDLQARIVPALAERWELVDGGRTLRFTLRQGVVMHDGQELTADDVKRSAERALHPGTPNNVASYFSGITGYAAYAGGKAEHLEGVTVEGRYVAAFHLDEPDAALLPLLAMPSMRPVCRSGGDRYVDTWLPCGAGPFKVEPGAWLRGASLRVVRHDGYYRPGLPYLDAVEWQFEVPGLSQRFRFEDGDLDLLRDVGSLDVMRFRADPRWKGLEVRLFDNAVNGESMNTRVPPFDRIEVRRAVAAAIDREHHALLNPANMTPQEQVLPRGSPGYDAAVVGQQHGLDSALEHMRKAGYPYDPRTGEGGWPEPIVYTVTERTSDSAVAQILQQELARIGLRLELRLVSFAAYLAITQRAGASAMSPQGWQADYPDPSAFFDPMFSSRAIRPDGSSNTAFYANPRVDDLLARAHREMNEAARWALYREANDVICDEAPWAFAYAQHDLVMRQPYVRGFAAHPVWPLDVRGVWLDRSEVQLPRALPGRPR